jgi:DNA ligase-1
MLACPLEIARVDRYPNYVMEPKLDGIRCISYKDNNGVVTLTSRGNKDLTEKVPHIVEALAKTQLRGTYLDGELGYWAGAMTIDFNKTTRVLGSGVDVALEKQLDNDEQIQYFIFDQPSSLEDWERRRAMFDWWISTYFPDDYEAPVVLVPRMDRFDEEWYVAYVNAGGEGVMLKNPTAAYHSGKRRANTWYKVKKFDTMDVRVISWKEGEGKYVGMCGALNVLNSDGLTFWVAGMDDIMRGRFATFFHAYDGKMCEIKHFGLTAGTPRFPQFLRMRPDLD